jgi:hypothetical protein
LELKEARKAKVPGSKQKFLDEFREAVEELNQIKAGKIKGRPAQYLIDEL